VVGPIYQEMINQIGEAKAAAILDAAIRKAAIAEGREFAARAPKGEAGRAEVLSVVGTWRWTAGPETGALLSSGRPDRK
jgi:hypothetical protein